ncbi:MAG: sulfite dehydrogenase [Gemmatimonadaceae bacterium]|nr:sulfite dehydrogenase [Gemmatimonadaceae bacterium]
MTRLSRRALLGGAAGLAGGALLRGLVPEVEAQAPTAPLQPPIDPTKAPGAPTTAVGARAPGEVALRAPTGEQAGNSLTPLHRLTGTITPADLHFERHHAGVPAITRAQHTLTIHGLVDRPLVLSVDDLARFPATTRTYFIECSGNGRAAFRKPTAAMTAQQIAGLTANSEWTGVTVRDLLAEVGVRRGASWALAEGGDACLLARSIPLAKLRDDAMIVWAQNGEALRPEQGYPLRLLLPGWEGNANVKWLRRLELGGEPWMTRWETAKYTDPLKNGTARIFSFEMDAKSIITAPTAPTVLPARGSWPITGLAWSGRGRITRVEVSTDGGTRWQEARVDGASNPKAHVRFTLPWRWTGGEALLMSRATDETGYTQPSKRVLVDVRGAGTDYHFNPIIAWHVASSGEISFAGDA